MSWRCTWCGTEHETDDPPCDSCGHNAFAPVDEDLETVDTGTQYVWVCPNCGREHVRNNPPCSRCGNSSLEQTEPDYADVERDLDVPGWTEVARPYAPVLVVLVLVVALFATGIVPLSALPGIGESTVPDAPGDGVEAAGIDLERTEGIVHDRLDAERGEAAARDYDDGLAGIAEYENRRLVVEAYADDVVDPVGVDEFDHDCGDSRPAAVAIEGLEASIDGYDDEVALATAIETRLLEEADELATGQYDGEGLDVHVGPDGDVYVVYAVC